MLHRVNKQNSRLKVMIKLVSDLSFWMDDCYYIENFYSKLTFFIYSVVGQAFNQGRTVNLAMIGLNIGLSPSLLL